MDQKSISFLDNTHFNDQSLRNNTFIQKFAKDDTISLGRLSAKSNRQMIRMVNHPRRRQKTLFISPQPKQIQLDYADLVNNETEKLSTEEGNRESRHATFNININTIEDVAGQLNSNTNRNNERK